MGTSLLVVILDAGSGRDAPRFRLGKMDSHWLSPMGRPGAMQAELRALGLGLDEALANDRKAGFNNNFFCSTEPEGLAC